jgi:SAM-dependent methyltransferase
MKKLKTRKKMLKGLLPSLGFLVISVLIFSGCNKKKPETNSNKPKLSQYQLLTGVSEEQSEKYIWDEKYSDKEYLYGKKPAEVISKSLDMFPRGKSLDLAMGEGRNAVFLARHGFSVDGVDFSDIAIKKARKLAREYKVKINPILADLSNYPIKKNTYDLIININFLERNLTKGIIEGLRPGGYLVFETYTIDHMKLKNKESIPEKWLLKKGELKEMFSELEIIKYQEVTTDKEAYATLIAKKK